MKEPKVILSTPEECRVLMRGWMLIGISRKPLEEKLGWRDVFVRVNWEELETKPVKHVRMLSDAEKHRARVRIFGVMKVERAKALKKKQQLELF